MNTSFMQCVIQMLILFYFIFILKMMITILIMKIYFHKTYICYRTLLKGTIFQYENMQCQTESINFGLFLKLRADFLVLYKYYIT